MVVASLVCEMSLDICTYRVEDHEDDAKQWEIEEERECVTCISVSFRLC